MALTLKRDVGDWVTYTGTGVNAADILFTTDELSLYSGFLLPSITGAVDVLGVLETGGTYLTAPISLQDLGAVTTTPVLVTVAGRLYGIVGNFHALKVRQSGATATNAILRGWRKSP